MSIIGPRETHGYRKTTVNNRTKPVRHGSNPRVRVRPAPAPSPPKKPRSGIAAVTAPPPEGAPAAPLGAPQREEGAHHKRPAFLHNDFPCAQVVVSALVLFDPATGYYDYFTVTSDGAFHPAVPLYPVGSGTPSEVTACV